MKQLRRVLSVWLLAAFFSQLAPLWAEEETAFETEEAVAEEAVTETEAVPEGTFTTLAELIGEDALGEEPSPDLEAEQALGMDGVVSLDLRGIDVSEALRYLAQKAGINLVLSSNVKGRVQLVLNDVPIRDIIDLVLLTNALAVEKRGEIYYVMTEAEYKARFGRSFSDAREVKIFRLKYAIPEQAFSLFEVLKSDIGRLLVDPESGTVLVVDTPSNIARMEQALAGLEEKKSTKVYGLQYAKAADIETRLRAQLDDKKVGSIHADERTNKVIVETLPERMKEIDAMIVELDQKTKEVLVDTKIIQVTLTDSLTAEIQWEGMFTRLAKYGTHFLGNHGLSPIARAGESFLDDFVRIEPEEQPAQGSKSILTQNLVFGALDNDDAFEALINFLKTIGDTKIISNPKLAVVNNQEAKILVGQKQAYVTTTTTSGTSTATTAESVTFVDVGIKLNVTPTINDDGYVTIKVKPEVSSVADFLVTPSGNKIPIVETATAETSVMVKDGVSIIIGGLRQDSKIEAHSRVPFLGDIPILGIPFNNTTRSKVRTELLIIMTPHIVQGNTLITQDGDRAGDVPILPYADYEEPLPAATVPPSAAPVSVTAKIVGATQ